MTLFETTQTLKRWVNSCDRNDQLDLLVKIVDQFVVERFTGLVTGELLNDAALELAIAISSRRTMIAVAPYQNNPRHDETNIEDIS